jgi:hypothetical protein
MAAGKFGLEGESSRERTMNRALWIVQALLALLFVFAGGMKLVMPVEEMTKQMPLSGGFIRFIGVCELLGGLGLVLPGLTGIQTVLTPIAAAGLVIIMIGATVISLQMGGLGFLFPLVTGLLLAFVAYGRLRFVPHRGSSSSPVSSSAMTAGR